MIVVCPRSAVTRLYAGGGVSHVLGLLGPGFDHPDLGLGEDRHCRLTFNDIAAPTEGLVAPGRDHVERLIGFVSSWDCSGGLLIHCWAGISRSTAAAFAAMCALAPDRDEAELARDLRRLSASATPNRLIVAHADQVLGRGGRMVEAAEAIGRGADAFEGNVIRWPLAGQ